MTNKLHSCAALALLFVSSTASAIPVTWTDWTSFSGTSAVGTIGNVGVSITADAINTSRTQTNCGTNWWTEPNASDLPYTGGTLDTAPTNCEQISLNSTTSVTVTFASAIDNLYMALLSVGQPGLAVTYNFDQSFTIDSEGQGFWGNDVTDGVINGNSLTMKEFHGVLLFDSPVTTLEFSAAPGEFWHAFTFGTTDVPEPGTLALLGLGLIGFGFAKKRRYS